MCDLCLAVIMIIIIDISVMICNQPTYVPARLLFFPPSCSMQGQSARPPLCGRPLPRALEGQAAPPWGPGGRGGPAEGPGGGYIGVRTPLKDDTTPQRTIQSPKKTIQRHEILNKAPIY